MIVVWDESTVVNAVPSGPTGERRSRIFTGFPRDGSDTLQSPCFAIIYRNEIVMMVGRSCGCENADADLMWLVNFLYNVFGFPWLRRISRDSEISRPASIAEFMAVMKN